MPTRTPTSRRPISNQTETIHLRDLVHDPTNARRHNPRNIGTIADALQEVGAARSIVLNENNVILAGNGLVEAAGLVGIEGVRIIDATGDEIIAVRRSNLTPAQQTRLALYDNAASDQSDFDPDVIRELMESPENPLQGILSDMEIEDIFAAAAIADANAAHDEDTPLDLSNVSTARRIPALTVRLEFHRELDAEAWRGFASFLEREYAHAEKTEDRILLFIDSYLPNQL